MFGLGKLELNRIALRREVNRSFTTGRAPQIMGRLAMSIIVSVAVSSAIADTGSISVTPATATLNSSTTTYTSTGTPYALTLEAHRSDESKPRAPWNLTASYTPQATPPGPETGVQLDLSTIKKCYHAVETAGSTPSISTTGTTILTGHISHHYSGALPLTSTGLTVTVPANATPGTYTGTITYTLSDVGNTFAPTSATATYTYTVVGLSSFSLTSNTITKSSTTGVVSLSGPAPTGGTVVTLTSQWPAYVSINGSNASSTTVTVPAGQTSVSFTISTPQMWSQTFSDLISATYNGIVYSQTLTVYSYALQSISVSPATVEAGGSATGTITLAGNAPAGGWPVSLTMSDSTWVTVPPSVTVPAGTNTVNFTVTTSSHAPTEGWLINGYDTAIYKDCPFNTINDSISSISLSQSVIGSGGSSIATVTLAAPAPAAWTVNIVVGAPGYLTLPSTLTIPQGSTTGQFTITGRTVGVTVGPIAIHVSDIASTASTMLTLEGDVISGVTVNGVTSTTVTGGLKATGSVTLASPAPLGGWQVRLESGAPGIAAVPATVTIPSGQTSVSFSITTGVVDISVGPIGIYASDGNTSQVGFLTVVPAS